MSGDRTAGSRPERTSVLLVDDEVNILAALRRLLRPWRDELDLTFAHGGQEALDALAGAEFDAVVSDVRMPGVGGAAVLAGARATRPATVRIVLSGYADQVAVVDNALVAHQFLAKPCDSDRLIGAIRAVGELKSLIPSADLRARLGSLAILPAAPTVLDRVRRLLAQDPTAEQLARAVTGDVALTAALLHLASAASTGPGGEITDLRSAVAYLGVPVVHQVIRTFDARGVAAVAPAGPDRRRTSLAETLAERLAGRPSVMPGDPAAGPDGPTLGDQVRPLGLLALATGQPGQMAEIIDAAPTGDAELLERERALFGVDHRQVGRYLARLWGLPPAIADAVGSAGPGDRPSSELAALRPMDRPLAVPPISIEDLGPDLDSGPCGGTRAEATRAAISVRLGGI